MNNQLKLALTAEQLDNTARSLPLRGTLFTSKYANRTGNGLPIFTTERAKERTKPRNMPSVLQSIHLDPLTVTDEYDADADQGIFYIRENSHLDGQTSVDLNTTTNATSKPTVSLVSLTINESINDSVEQPISTVCSSNFPPSKPFKTLPQRKLQRLQHRNHLPPAGEQQQNNRLLDATQLDDPANTPIAMMSRPTLLDLATHARPQLTDGAPNSLGIDSISKFSFDTQTDANGINHHRLYINPDNLLRPFAKNDTPILRTSTSLGTKPPTNGTSNRPSSHRAHSRNQLQQPFVTIESVLKERSIALSRENLHQPDALERVNQILKQLYFAPEKK